MTSDEQRRAAKAFAVYWKGKGYEKGESQPFWLSLLRDVYGVEHPEEYISFEDKVHIDHASFIDGYIETTHVLIEQKGLGKDLRRGIRQSDVSLLSPFQQAKRYAAELPYSLRPRWIVTCNFAEFFVYDMEKPNGEPERILLEDLPAEYYRLGFLIKADDEHIKKEMAVSLKAGELVGRLYNAILKEYIDPESPETLRSLNMLCVRLVFCLYAEDAGIFGRRNMFHDYLRAFDKTTIRRAIIDLFKILDTEKRDPYDKTLLSEFPYVNGGLFRDESIEIPNFSDEIIDLLLNTASDGFDWSSISPTIFGAVFESTLNPETRRSGGMHYTSIENIHKVIDPLFLDGLHHELEEIKASKQPNVRERRLREFQDKLSRLRFLDPACGSGNFLTETYLSLRRLENEVIKILHGDQIVFETGDIIKVSIDQFCGIEINDFAVTVAKTALWIAESQMMKETEDIVKSHLDFLPLTSNAGIVEANALRIDWETVTPRETLSYIMGNPPFVGASMMSDSQKSEAVNIFGKIKLSNSIDYVGAWYCKTADFMEGTKIKAALVSTNSITQGEQTAPLWRTLIEKYKVHICFAYRTFRWDSEASLKAHVHCVIIGFSRYDDGQPKIIYDNDRLNLAENINPYLLNAPNVFIESRGTPICSVPKMTKGNQPTDGGNLILSTEERNEILKSDPNLSCCIRRYVGARDYLNNDEIRYCLWLKGISPTVYRKNKEIMRRLENVKAMRLKSTAEPTRKSAEKPYQFFSTPQTDNTYLIVPRVSSEKRKYIPIGFMDPEVIAADSCSIVPDATLYHFGILTSNVHMAWMKTVCGRLEMRYRYSGSIVYNNFPWPTPDKEQTARIESTARAILDARALYPDCSLADLYDDLTMPRELRAAHRANDYAVIAAYGFPRDITESECTAELMKLYRSLTDR